MKKTIFIFISILILSGCAAQKAMDQPVKKDLSVLQPKTERKLVIGELGEPVHTEKNEKGCYVDTYSFIQGYSKGSKSARAAGHTLMTIGTLGIWEIFGTAIEGSATGDRVVVEVTYDERDLLEHCRVLKGKEVIPEEVAR